MPGLTSTERILRARLAAHTSWGATPDRAARTAPARAALDAKFLDAADGDPARAANLRQAHYYRLSLKSAQARRKGREARQSAAVDGDQHDLHHGDQHDLQHELADQDLARGAIP